MNAKSIRGRRRARRAAVVGTGRLALVAIAAGPATGRAQATASAPGSTLPRVLGCYVLEPGP